MVNKIRFALNNEQGRTREHSTPNREADSSLHRLPFGSHVTIEALITSCKHHRNCYNSSYGLIFCPVA
jgi:hypothetical protein